MAQSTYRSIATTGDTSASSIAVSKPSGVADGDVLVAIFAWDTGSSFTLNTLSGWTLIRTDSVASGVTNLASYYKVASSEGSSYTWTFTGSVSCAGAIIRIDTADTSSVLDTSNGAGTNAGNTNSLTFTDTVTPGLANELIIFPIFARASGHANLTGMSAQAVTTSDPSWTEVADILLVNVSGSTASGVFSIAYANRTQTTATGDSSATCSGGIGPNRYIAQKIVIKNQTVFTTTTSDTVTDSDSIVASISTSTTASENLACSDSSTITKQRDWNTLNKNSSIWVNQDKN